MTALLKQFAKLIFGKQLPYTPTQKIIATYGSIFLVMVSLVLTLLNINNKNWFMTGTTSVLALGFVVSTVFAFLKKIKVSRILIAIMCGIIFSIFAITGENDGFAILWILLVPILSMQLVGLRIGFIISAYFQLFLIVLFYTPLLNYVRNYYTSTFLIRFPLLYLATFILCLLLMCQYQNLFNDTHKQAFEDSLTGLYNRNYYNKVFNDLEETPDITAVSMDLNGLKYMNDNFGHEAGDKLLQNVSNSIKSTFPDDTAFRLGGDEFLVVSTDPSVITRAESFRQIMPNVAMGIASRADHPDISFHELIKIADAEMYKDKSNYYSQPGHDRRK